MKKLLLPLALLVAGPAWADQTEEAEATAEAAPADAKTADAPKLTDAERAKLLGLMELPVEAHAAREAGVPEEEIKAVVAEAGKGSKTSAEVKAILADKKATAAKGGVKVGQERGAGKSGDAPGQAKKAAAQAEAAEKGEAVRKTLDAADKKAEAAGKKAGAAGKNAAAQTAAEAKKAGKAAADTEEPAVKATRAAGAATNKAAGAAAKDVKASTGNPKEGRTNPKEGK